METENLLNLFYVFLGVVLANITYNYIKKCFYKY